MSHELNKGLISQYSSGKKADQDAKRPLFSQKITPWPGTLVGDGKCLKSSQHSDDHTCIFQNIPVAAMQRMNQRTKPRVGMLGSCYNKTGI